MIRSLVRILPLSLYADHRESIPSTRDYYERRPADSGSQRTLTSYCVSDLGLLLLTCVPLCCDTMRCSTEINHHQQQRVVCVWHSGYGVSGYGYMAVVPDHHWITAKRATQKYPFSSCLTGFRQQSPWRPKKCHQRTMQKTIRTERESKYWINIQFSN